MMQLYAPFLEDAEYSCWIPANFDFLVLKFIDMQFIADFEHFLFHFKFDDFIFGGAKLVLYKRLANWLKYKCMKDNLPETQDDDLVVHCAERMGERNQACLWGAYEGQRSQRDNLSFTGENLQKKCHQKEVEQQNESDRLSTDLRIDEIKGSYEPDEYPADLTE